jgi:hypothetical protein
MTTQEAHCHLLQPKKNQHQGFFSWVAKDEVGMLVVLFWFFVFFCFFLEL